MRRGRGSVGERGEETANTFIVNVIAERRVRLRGTLVATAAFRNG